MELLDIYNDNGKITGKVVERGKNNISFEKGEHIAVSIIFIQNSNDEFLIQKTSKQKGEKFSSTGGHVLHNEKPIDAIKREVKEELGIDISNDNVIDLGYTIFDFPIRFLFYLKKDINLKDIALQLNEVESISYMSIKKIKDIINNGLMLETHTKLFKEVLKYIKTK